MAELDRIDNPGPWTGLGWKLFLAFAAVIAVGVITVWIAIGFAAPRFFDQQVAGMMGGAGGMMGGSTGAMGATMDVAITAAFRDAVTQALLVATAAAVVVAVVASLFVTRRIVGPLQRLASASQRIADGHYAERVPLTSRDELGDVARSFNAMASALETTERRRRELLGDVAHDCARRSPRSKAIWRVCSMASSSRGQRRGRDFTARPGDSGGSSTTCKNFRAPRPARSLSRCVQPIRPRSSRFRWIAWLRRSMKKAWICTRRSRRSCHLFGQMRTEPCRFSAICSATLCGTHPLQARSS